MKGVDSTKQEQSQPRFDLDELSLNPLFSTVLLFMHERSQGLGNALNIYDVICRVKARAVSILTVRELTSAPSAE
jgi:hypothetical protein